MTDDIVTMLRKEYDHFNQDGVGDYELLTTAADEIERLREKIQDLRMHAEQDACEIERLRATIGGWSQDISNLQDEVDQLRKDNPT